MAPELWLAVGGLFASVGLMTGLGVSTLLARMSPERRRLREAAVVAGGPGPLIDQMRLTENVSPRLQSVASKLPKEPFKSNRSQPTQDAGKLERRDATDAEQVDGLRVVAKQQRSTLGGTPPTRNAH